MTTLNERFAAPVCECGFSSRDISLMNNHNCETQQNGGVCEDYPCCGHERGDCNGLRYGSDAKIIEDTMRAMSDSDLEWAMDMQADYDEVWG